MVIFLRFVSKMIPKNVFLSLTQMSALLDKEIFDTRYDFYDI